MGFGNVASYALKMKGRGKDTMSICFLPLDACKLDEVCSKFTETNFISSLILVPVTWTVAPKT